jgi:hypothetical protein
MRSELRRGIPIFWVVAEGMLLRTASPLTPALSPLRGEGVARGASKRSDTLRREGADWCSIVRSTSDKPVARTRHRRVRAHSNLRETLCASPSPLDGERAGPSPRRSGNSVSRVRNGFGRAGGVRGEAVRREHRFHH